MQLEKFIDQEFLVYVDLLQSLFSHQGNVDKKQLFNEVKGLTPQNMEEKLDILNHSSLMIDLKRRVNITKDSIKLIIPNGLTFNYIVSYFVHKSFGFRLISFSIKQSKPVKTSKILFKFNLSRSSYYRYLKKVNLILKSFDLTIKNGQLLGNYLQKISFIFEINWSTQANKIYTVTTISNKSLEKILKSVDESVTIFNLTKLSTFIKALLAVDKYAELDENSKKLLNSSIFNEVDSYIQALHFVLNPFFSDADFVFSKLFFVFLICLICDNDSKVVRAWVKGNKRQATTIYDATCTIAVKLNCFSIVDSDKCFNQLLLLHTLFSFKINGINVNSSPEKNDIVNNWFGLNIIKKLTTIIQPIFKNPKYTTIFNPKSWNWLLRYYSIFFIVNLKNQTKKIVIGVYSGRSFLLSEFLRTNIQHISPVNTEVNIIDPYHLDFGYDLIISDIVTYLPDVSKVNTYQLAYYNSQLDYINLTKKINKIILEKFFS